MPQGALGFLGRVGPQKELWTSLWCPPGCSPEFKWWKRDADNEDRGMARIRFPRRCRTFRAQARSGPAATPLLSAVLAAGDHPCWWSPLLVVTPVGGHPCWWSPTLLALARP